MSFEIVNLDKGGRIDLSKAAPGASKFKFALGWDPQPYNNGDEFDLDASAFLTKDGKCISAADLFGYFTTGFVTEDMLKQNSSLKPGLQNYRGFISHSGDDLNGALPGDDEVITVDTAKIDLNACNEIQFNVTIYDSIARKQTFGMVNNAFIRVDDAQTGKTICKYDLSEDYSGNTAVVIGKLYHKEGTWRFQAVGGGFKEGLSGLISNVGLAAKNG
jgi:tellurium resistance protein TerD